MEKKKLLFSMHQAWAYSISDVPPKVSHSNLECSMHHRKIILCFTVFDLTIHSKENVFKYLDGFFT